MNSDWIDDLLGGSDNSGENISDSFYCPYTNTTVCALNKNGWQPQELCEVLECSQLKFFKGKKRRKHAA
jgi:hypothetical protein